MSEVGGPLHIANVAAWRQRHHHAYQIVETDLIDRSICPCCGLLLSREWFNTIWGCEPEAFRQCVESPLRWSAS